MRPRTPEQLWALSRRLHARGWRRLAKAVKVTNYFVHRCLLPAEAEVGEGLVLEHYALGVVIHPQVKIGRNCRIYHHVTLAAESCLGGSHHIVLQDGATIGAHSVVVARPNSDLVIGRNATLGAGSVLTKDIPAGEIWAGVPARKIGEVEERAKRLGFAVA